MADLLQEPFLLGLSFVELEHSYKSSRDKWQDDRESTIRPPPIRIMEVFCQFRSCIRGDNPWRGREGICETSIFQRRSVGSGDIDGEDDTDKPDRVEALYVNPDL